MTKEERRRAMTPTSIRLPSDLKERMQQRAEKNGRTFTHEVIKALEQHLNPNRQWVEGGD